MSQNESQKIHVTITVSQEFHQVLEKMAKAYDHSVEEYVIDQLICGIDSDLQAPAGPLFGFEECKDYCDQLRALAAGGTA